MLQHAAKFHLGACWLQRSFGFFDRSGRKTPSSVNEVVGSVWVWGGFLISMLYFDHFSVPSLTAWLPLPQQLRYVCGEICMWSIPLSPMRRRTCGSRYPNENPFLVVGTWLLDCKVFSLIFPVFFFLPHFQSQSCEQRPSAP